MDDRRFDALTRAFGRGTSRRTAIKGLFGGAVGGVAIATHLGSVGAQAECTPQTIGEDCRLPDACTSATCPDGECVYSSGCDDTCAPCNVLSGQCEEIVCGACQVCERGTCVDSCDEGELCCNGTCAQCCSDGDCVADAANFCSSVACISGICTNVPECPEGQNCCGLGQEGAYCAECCSSDDCIGCAVCNEVGQCSDPECCYDTDCGDCYVCGENGICAPLLCLLGYECCGGHECVPEDQCCKGAGDYCGLTAADSHQYDCCDGLVCCHQGDASVCAQCCNDWDCDHGGHCNHGWCEYPTYCKSDYECPKGTCCCHDGSCSGKCCDHHHHPHPKPPAPTPTPAPAAGGTTTLPNTGSGGRDEQSSGVLGAAALGAAAAFLAAKKLKENSEAPAEE